MQYRPYRYQTQFPINLLSPAGRQQCQITDVNSHGARILGPVKLRSGDKVRFHVQNTEITAIVRWCNANRAGLTFRPHISAALVDRLRYRQDSGRYGHQRQAPFSFAELR